MDIFQCPKILVPTVFGRYYFMRFRWKTLDLNSLTDRLIHVQIVYPAKKASRTKCVKRTTGFGEPDTSKSVRSRKIIFGSKKKKKCIGSFNPIAIYVFFFPFRARPRPPLVTIYPFPSPYAHTCSSQPSYPATISVPLPRRGSFSFAYKII